MKLKKVVIPADRIWIEVSDLKSAIDAWTEIQQDILESSVEATQNDYDEV